ncbi:MAG: hypothetical protein IK142_02595 [Clostridiales bacterium]|nr:hypothetical protein [Clostridiales bacterium]
MMTIKEFVTWLESQGVDGVYEGYIPKDKERVIGVYKRPDVAQPEAYGQSSYNILGLTILIHWTKGMEATETQANALNALLDRAPFSTTSHTGWIKVTRGPVDVGKDEKGICEWTIDISVYAKPINTGGNNNG